MFTSYIYDRVNKIEMYPLPFLYRQPYSVFYSRMQNAVEGQLKNMRYIENEM